ncbi:hypothetical protein ABIE13_001811 [Ottowia thiooxydans]|uniref:Uncharacterized protein n=1 Tax=Ottowia thiooxydans TaxID=219182 RepID=A0ABV2Q7X0_9BURK
MSFFRQGLNMSVMVPLEALGVLSAGFRFVSVYVRGGGYGLPTQALSLKPGCGGKRECRAGARRSQGNSRFEISCR